MSRDPGIPALGEDVNITVHTPATCTCPPTADIEGCPLGYTFVLESSGVRLGGFIDEASALRAAARWGV